MGKGRQDASGAEPYGSALSISFGMRTYSALTNTIMSVSGAPSSMIGSG